MPSIETDPSPHSAINKVDFTQLAKRIGEDHLRERLKLQAEHVAGLTTQGHGLWKFQDAIPLKAIIAQIIKISGLYSRGYRNYLDIQLVENTVTLRRLPRAFDGFKILQIADLHADLDPQLIDIVIQKLKGLEYDICVNTGDFRNCTRACYYQAMLEMRPLCEQIEKPHYGVLGNHDFIEKIAELESLGMHLLLNESTCLERDDEQLWLLGIDDANYYKTHDLPRALRHAPADACKILLSHSPEAYDEAAQQNIDLMLSGHTHGGQICLPGGHAIITHCHVPTELIAGPWQHDNLQGYTSRGTGGGSIPVRYNCPAEITLHTLRCSESS